MHHYLVQRVSLPDLRQFIAMHYADIAAGLPDSVVGVDQYVFAVIERLRQFGYLERELFLRLGEFRKHDDALRTAAVACLGLDPFPAGGPGGPVTDKQVALVLMACPEGQAPLELAREAGDIEDELGLGPVRERFSLVWGWSVTAEQTFDLITDHNPVLLHFAGHGGSDGTMLVVGAEGSTTRLRYDALARLLGALRQPPRCVVLNACFSGLATAVLTERVDAVVGMRERISDEAARIFSRALYRAIGKGKDLQESFGIARAALGSLDPREDHLPLLSCRARVDPGGIRF
ncbi:CHAT domain-containing protein [Nannocystis bainbridge]|uniref:CHAT domain-containing protein n=1 Tax=Nannocystis bainbridge TaxID=2995303 RepID=A0ABT5E643_9BACT|nr:CHAT domain-containing protein [Nannocystis bainbridge]MDC0721328.1 CHAT domain-containing protein [Nannocystis bainbridge]